MQSSPPQQQKNHLSFAQLVTSSKVTFTQTISSTDEDIGSLRPGFWKRRGKKNLDYITTIMLKVLQWMKEFWWNFVEIILSVMG